MRMYCRRYFEFSPLDSAFHAGYSRCCAMPLRYFAVILALRYADARPAPRHAAARYAA